LHASVISSALVGVDAFPVEVEIDIGAGIPPHRLVGLAEGAVKEALDRVKSALKNSGFDFPTRKMTINLAPADTRKEGSAFDLPARAWNPRRAKRTERSPAAARVPCPWRARARRPHQRYQGRAADRVARALGQVRGRDAAA